MREEERREVTHDIKAKEIAIGNVLLMTFIIKPNMSAFISRQVPLCAVGHYKRDEVKCWGPHTYSPFQHLVKPPRDHVKVVPEELGSGD